MSTHKNRVEMSVTGTPGTGTITLNAASSGYQSFASAYGGNATVDILIVDGTAWEVARDCTYTNSGTTVTRGTLEASSTGSTISLTSAAIVSEIMTAGFGNDLENQISRGVVIVRNSGSGTTTLTTSTFTKLTCINSEEYDALGWWDNSNQRFQPTRAGMYLAVCGTQITFSGYSADTPVSAICLIRKNGTDFAHLARGWLYDDAAGSLNLGVSGSCLVYLNGSSDYIEPFAWQNSGVNQTTVVGAERQFFMASYLSET